MLDSTLYVVLYITTKFYMLHDNGYGEYKAAFVGSDLLLLSWTIHVLANIVHEK